MQGPFISVKGNSIYYIKRYIIDTYGINFYKKIIQNIDDDTRSILSSPIISQEKYNLKVKDLLLTALLENTSEEELRKCSTQEVHQQLKGMLLLFVKMLSVRFLVKHIQKIWNQHFSGGIVTSTYNEDNKTVVITVRNCKANKAFWIHVEQYIKTLYEIVLRKEVRSFNKQASLLHTEIYIQM